MSSANVALGWDSEVWNKIQQAVDVEAERTKIPDKIIPINGPITGAVNVPSHVTIVDIYTEYKIQALVCSSAGI